MNKNIMLLVLSFFIMTLISIPQAMAEEEHKIIIEKAGGTMTITRKVDANGMISSSVTFANQQEGKCGEGPISELEIKFGGKNRKVTAIDDNTVIETHDSPGCILYIINGRYFWVCN